VIKSSNCTSLMKTFSGKTAVITGAASGLGRSFAIHLANAGANLALCDVNMDGLEETRGLIGENKLCVSLHRVDVSEQVQMEKFAVDVLAEHSTIDLLINNAGICYRPMRFEETTQAQFERMLAINFWGTFNGIRAFVPHLKTRPEAGILNVASLAGLVGLYGHSAYSISKSALKGMTEALQAELSGTNVHVMIAYPGGVRTNLIRNAPNVPPEERGVSHDLFTKLSFLDADRTTARILRALRRGRYRSIIGLDSKMILIVRKWIPQAYPAIAREFFRHASFKPEDK